MRDCDFTCPFKNVRKFLDTTNPAPSVTVLFFGYVTGEESGLNDRASWNYSMFGNNYDPVTNIMVIAIEHRSIREGFDNHIVADAGILVDDRAFDLTIPANTNGSAVTQPYQSAPITIVSRISFFTTVVNQYGYV